MNEHHEKQLLLQWLDDLAVAQHAQHTLVAYHHDISSFLTYCEQQKITLNALQKADLRSYMTFCIEQKGWENSTLQRALSSIRQFMQWYSRRQSVLDPVKDFQIKRTPRRLPGMLSVTDINRLLNQPSPDKPQEQWLWQRDKAMLELLYSSGLRLSELVNLQLLDLDFHQQLVRVTGKGNKTRIVPIGSQAILALRQWLTVRGSPSHHSVFVSQHGQPISPRQVQNRIKLQAQRAGLSADIHPHLLRHCFATHVLSNSGELRAVQDMLGHSSLSSTQVYTHLDFDRLNAAYDQAHPRAKK